MNFFKSVFSDDDYQQHEEEQVPEPLLDDHNPDPNPNPPATGTAWSFGGLMKTIASRSESVIQTYRRDLEDFGSELKKETAVIREVATRAVKVLPASLEVGASVAQESLESVGQAIDDFGSSVFKEAVEIISHGKDAILAADQDTDSSSDNSSSSSNFNNNQQFGDRGLDSKRYSRFDAQLHAIQIDANTYCEEPEDLNDYGNWKLGFVIDEKDEEIEGLIEENGVMEDIYRKLVPSAVDHESFWSRYFYRVYNLKQAEEARAKLVKRVTSGEEEEDLTWDFDDEEEDEENNGVATRGDLAGNRGLESTDSVGVAKENEKFEGSRVETSSSGEKSLLSENDDKSIIVESIKNDDGADHNETLEVKSDLSEVKADNTEGKSDEKMDPEGKIDNGESCKDSDISIVSNPPSLPEEEEDLGWDEIEDIGSNDENKVEVGGSPSRVDLRKQLSAAEEEEDLTWDIEDDDEPIRP